MTVINRDFKNDANNDPQLSFSSHSYCNMDSHLWRENHLG